MNINRPERLYYSIRNVIILKCLNRTIHLKYDTNKISSSIEENLYITRLNVTHASLGEIRRAHVLNLSRVKYSSSFTHYFNVQKYLQYFPTLDLHEFKVFATSLLVPKISNCDER